MAGLCLLRKSYGHPFVFSTNIQNVADRMICNVLFGLDDDRIAKETGHDG
jgi:hypothetical protein